HRDHGRDLTLHERRRDTCKLIFAIAFPALAGIQHNEAQRAVSVQDLTEPIAADGVLRAAVVLERQHATPCLSHELPMTDEVEYVEFAFRQATCELTQRRW